MKKRRRTKRRILSAGAGMVAITAVEGLACGNPVSPRYDTPYEEDPAAVEPADETNDMPLVVSDPDDAGSGAAPDGSVDDAEPDVP